MPELARLFSDLVRVETRLWNLVDARLRTELDVSLARYETMSVIHRRRRCRPLDIAGDLGITVSGTSKILARVEAAGHCVRVSNPDDGRSLFVELTDAGRTALLQADEVVDNELSAYVGSALSPREIEALAAALRRLKTSASASRPEQGVAT